MASKKYHRKRNATKKRKIGRKYKKSSCRKTGGVRSYLNNFFVNETPEQKKNKLIIIRKKQLNDTLNRLRTELDKKYKYLNQGRILIYADSFTRLLFESQYLLARLDLIDFERQFIHLYEDKIFKNYKIHNSIKQIIKNKYMEERLFFFDDYSTPINPTPINPTPTAENLDENKPDEHIPEDNNVYPFTSTHTPP